MLLSLNPCSLLYHFIILLASHADIANDPMVRFPRGLHPSTMNAANKCLPSFEDLELRSASAERIGLVFRESAGLERSHLSSAFISAVLCLYR